MICSIGGSILIGRGTRIPRLPIIRGPSKFYVNEESCALPVSIAVFRRSSSSSMAMEVKIMGSGSPTLILTSGASGRVRALFSMRELKRLVMIIQAMILFLFLPIRVVVWRQWTSTVVVREEKQERKVRVPPPSTIAALKRNADCSGGVVTPATVVVDEDVAVRRSLAVRRVLEDDVGVGSSAREFSLFTTRRGDTLFTQSWTPVSSKTRGVVVLLHGLNEHSGRYSDFAKQLNGNGFKVYGIDWIGHGGSDGLHAYVPSLDYAVDDLKSYLEKVLTENPGLPCFCFGHSTGGAIILKAMLDPKIEARISGIVLTSPAVGVQPSHPIYTVLAPIVSFLLPRYQVSVANKKGLPVSRDPQALIAKYSDPLVFTGSIRVRTGYEILRIAAYLQQNLDKVRVPFLVLHGTDDTVTDPEASQKLYDQASSSDKTIKLFDGLLHDLLFEPEREAVTGVITEWLNRRV
ncbi:PREDICTED: monoglyceride lipase [Tarenaya hassleriana]|uniref:monoglyceride lipase n=1 Tax=Tarenaya hassleriana TaxID=28532 RepID=UPI00053C6305|nr:PREDICTED: monoglyceride lipase [Tarenaya hassleriana]